jgi:hypothetical protein
MQKVLYGIGPFILPSQNRGFVCIQDEWFCMGNVLSCTIEISDGSTIVPTVYPFVVDSKFGISEVRLLA